MFAITLAPSADGTSTSIRHLPSCIAASSPFTPACWICPACTSQNPVSDLVCATATCTQTLTSACPLLDQRGHPVIRARFPAHWLCSTCHLPHDVLSILVQKPACGCGKPTLQAVYDQFGDLLLFWRDDEQIRDLSDGGKVEEAARRLWMVGAEVWVDEMPLIRIREDGDKEESMEMAVISSERTVVVDVAA